MRNRTYNNIYSHYNQHKKYKQPSGDSLIILPEKSFFRLKTAYQLPREIGNFSYNNQREFVYDDSQLRYYYPADLRYPSLATGFENYIERDVTKLEHLDGLLKFLELSKHPEKKDIDFVLYRGVMTRILISPYQNRDTFRLAVTKFKNVIYIDEIKEIPMEESPEMKRFCFYGYKFETLSTLPNFPKKDEPEVLDKMLKERLEEVVDNNSELASVFISSLGNHKLLMGAEVDCVQDNSPEKKYLELKTSRVIENERQRNTFERYKLLKFWAQSYLAGIPKIVVGFRDDSGNLVEIKTFNTLEIPESVNHIKGIWKPEVCKAFASSFLDWLKSNVIEDDPYACYIVTYEPDKKKFSISLETKPCSFNFLTKEYIDSLSKSYN